jgi:hypothetical protein
MLPNRSNEFPTARETARVEPARPSSRPAATFEDLLQEAIDASNRFRNTVDRLPGRLSNRRG